MANTHYLNTSFTRSQWGRQKTTSHLASSSKIKKRVPPKSWVLSQAKRGMFTIRSKPTYGSGSVSLEQLHQVAMGTTKPTTSSVIPTRKSAQGTTLFLKLQREKTQQNKNGNPSPILITKSSLRQQPILKNKLLTHGNKTIHTEKLDDNMGKTHGGPQLRNTKLPLNPEGKIKHRTTSFLLPEDCVKKQKQVISEILESIKSHNKEEHRGNDCGLTHKKNEVCCFSICKQTEQVNVTILDESGYSLWASGLLFSHVM